MPLAPGTRLGPYEITALIGKGGMGEVYKAHDTRLRRDVAIKTSAQRFTARFELEARAIAALNHPNICQIYDVGPDYLVMELIEGPTLAERIKQGAVPLEEAEPIAMQIALALEAAHEKKITHRDLKPGNIKIKPDGVVKVLDFGLAKVGQALPPDAPGEDSPTLTMNLGLTEAGMILGTAAYMSPEQARGKPVDHRADIWAFGVVLHEMLTGKRLFTGEELADVLASVVKDAPDFSAIPRRMRKLAEACLQKEVARRLQSIGDARLLLAEDETERLTAPSRSRLGSGGWIAAGGMALAVGVALWAPWREASVEPPLLRASITPPLANSLSGLFALSPDGKRVALMLRVTEGQSARYLAIHPLDSEEYRAVPGAEDARDLFWSPDSRFLAFTTNDPSGKLKLIPAAGGPVQELCSEVGTGRGVSWNKDGVVLVASTAGPVRQVKVVNGSAAGACTAVTKLETASTIHRFPQFTSDGNHFLYQTGVNPNQTLMVAALDTPDIPARKVMPVETQVTYVAASPGEKYAHLVIPRNNRALMAQEFDDRALAPVGDPVEILPQISGRAADQASFSIAATGLMLYNPDPPVDARLKWFDRSGKEVGTIGPYQGPFGLSLSPDETRVITARDRKENWAYDLVGNGAESRFDMRSLGVVVWSPDGARVAYGYENKLYRASSLGSEEEVLFGGKNTVKPSQWSTDGKVLFFTENDPKARADIWYLPDPGGKAGKPVKFLATDAQESQAQLSPDGRSVAYTSDETGRNEIWLRSFPDGANKRRVSRSGGAQPRWKADGSALYFVAPSGGLTMPSGGLTIMETAVSPEAQPKPLFTFRGLNYVTYANQYTYATTKDGTRFLIGELRDRGEAQGIALITDWHKLLPVK